MFKKLQSDSGHHQQVASDTMKRSEQQFNLFQESVNSQLEKFGFDIERRMTISDMEMNFKKLSDVL